MNEFLELFGELNIANVVTLATACSFLAATYHKIKKNLIDKHDIEESKEEKINEIVATVKDFAEYKNKNIEIQESIAKQVQELSDRITKMETEQTTRAKNNIRDKLIKYYQHYTNIDTNPNQSWTEMEEHAFKELLKDYTNAGGNDYIHSVVEPAMDKLTVIKII